MWRTAQAVRAKPLVAAARQNFGGGTKGWARVVVARSWVTANADTTAGGCKITSASVTAAVSKAAHVSPPQPAVEQASLGAARWQQCSLEAAASSTQVTTGIVAPQATSKAS